MNAQNELLSKVFEHLTERMKSQRPGRLSASSKLELNQATSGPSSDLGAAIKEKLGFDPNDPTVTVEIFPAAGRSANEVFEAVFGSKGQNPEQETAANDNTSAVEPEPTIDDKINSILVEVADELHFAREKHPRSFNSPHEGYAVIKEELDELWETIKIDGGGRSEDARDEAIQVAAMAVRFALDLCQSDET